MDGGGDEVLLIFEFLATEIPPAVFTNSIKFKVTTGSIPATKNYLFIFTFFSLNYILFLVFKQTKKALNLKSCMCHC